MAVPDSDLQCPDALIEPTRPVSLGFQILLGLASAGPVISLLPVLTVLIPAQVTQIDTVHPENSLAAVLTSGAIAALVGNLLTGLLSDRTTSRFGRRRPWLLLGTLGVAGGLSILTSSRTIPMLAAGWFLAQFFGNMLMSSYNAVLPDRVPIHQRGTTQSIIGLSGPIGIILSDIFFVQIKELRSAYPPIMIIQAVMALLFIVFYREAKLPKEALTPFSMLSFLRSLWVSPRKHPGFAFAWLMWFMVWLGYTLGTGSFFFLYLQNITHYESLFPGHMVKEGIATIQILQIVVGVPLMMAAGVLSDRTGRLKTFVSAGVLLVGMGLVALTGFSSWGMVLAASVVIGAGFWVYYSQGVAMISQVLPSAANRGKDLGVINIAATLPQVIMPPVGAMMINSAGNTNPQGYQILFGIGALAVFLGLFLIRLIRRN